MGSISSSLYTVWNSNNQRKTKYTKGPMVFSPKGSQITISPDTLPLHSSFYISYLEFRDPPPTLDLPSEGDSIKHSSSPFRKTFIRWLLLAEIAKAAHICPFPADNNVYDFYFPNPQFKSRWEGMSQREIPLLLADDSSVIICIFLNLQNVNILEKNADISYFIPDEVPCCSLAPHPPLSESLTSGY